MEWFSGGRTIKTADGCSCLKIQKAGILEINRVNRKGGIMNRVFLIFISLFAVTLLWSGGVYAGQAPGTGILETAHDLSLATGRGGLYNQTDTLDRICVYCHAPHHTLKLADAAGIQYLPLWNHEVTVQSYITYANGPDDPSDPSHVSGAEATAGQPGSVSRLCLSCHDGTVAVNEYGFDPGNPASRGDADAFIAARYQIGINNDLSNHHPIGFDYAAVQGADDEIAPTTASLGAYQIGDLLWAGKMECTTCHDVHNTKNTGETFLWISNQHSEFCCACHLKCQ